MRVIVVACVLSVVCVACSDGAGSSSTDAGRDADVHSAALRLDQIQLEATHNSYHVETPGTTIPDWKYTAAPLDEQLDRGVRGVELDTHFDATSGELLVHHVPGLDEGTTCDTLRKCLGVLEAWSSKHPSHHTLFIHLEPKDMDVGEMPDFAQYADALDAVLLDVWGRQRIVAPADVQGDFDSLREAVTSVGFPEVSATRGKILAYLDERGPFHDAYTRGGSDLSGRMAFPSSMVDEPIAAVVISNDPNDPATRAAVEAGFLVRTRADSIPVADDWADTRRAALASGAQIVTTDFPVAGSGVDAFELPGGMPSRCNPVTAPAACAVQDVEDPATLDAAP